ncbi:hypothetical protein ACKAV7_013061 [Fusarium commune]|nr:hypothetical protein LZL87_014014 [Fusarium oxysporum]
MTVIFNEKTDGSKTDIKLLESVHESIRKAGFAAKPLNATPTDEETDEEEENLPLINLADYTEVEMPSSPPCLPNYESSQRHVHINTIAKFTSPSEVSLWK